MTDTVPPPVRDKYLTQGRRKRSPRSRRGGRGRDFPRWLVTLLAVVFSVLVIPPLVYLLVVSATIQDFATGAITAVTWQNYARVLGSSETLISLRNSFVFAAGSGLIALTLGGTQALIVERTNAPLRQIAYLVAVISLAVPYVLYTIAWVLLLGTAGPVNELLATIFGTGEAPVFNVYSLTGMILVEGFLWSPLSFLMLASSFRNANASLEEAALMSGATLRQTLSRITLRLSMPAILAILMLVFIRAVEAFEVPALVGLPGGVDVLTTDIFLSIRQTSPPDYGYASAFSVLMLIVVAVLLYFYGRLSRSAGKYSSITGKSGGAKLIDLGRWRFLATGLLVANAVVLLVLPLSLLVWAALSPFYVPFSAEAASRLTLMHFETALTADQYVDDIRNTLVLSAGAATLVLGFTALAAWLAVRRASGGRYLDYIATTPLIIPGIVMGVAILSLYILVPLPIYGTLWILLIAFVTRYLPYGMRYSFSGILQISRELEESARVSGAEPVTVFRRIVAPLIMPSLAAGWFFVFLIAARELTMAILLSSAGTTVVSVRLFDLWQNGMLTELAAFGVVWSAIMSMAAASCYYLAKRAGIDMY